MSKYWQKREAEQRLRHQLKSEAELSRKLESLYRQAAKDITNEMASLYHTLLLEGDETLMNNLFMYNRYFQMREMINKQLTALGKKELVELEGSLFKMYQWTSKRTLSSLNFQLPNKKEMDKLIQSLWDNRGSWSSSVWCKDGLSGAERVAKSMAQLQQQLEKGMLDCVGRGVSKDELVKTLMHRFGVSYSDAARLARTELTYIQNQATLDSYAKAGVEEYEFLAEDDDRISDICEELNGQRFPLELAIVGVNYPPMHPNCRSTVLAVINGQV